MRVSVAALVALLLLNGAVAAMRDRLAEEQEGLRERAAEQETASELGASEEKRHRALATLIERARVHGLPHRLGVGAIRDLLIDAQRGLSIDRLSLEFRPAEDTVAGQDGSQISAFLAGSFEGLFDYLARIESLKLPLTPRGLSLQQDSAAGGGLGLNIRWTALWEANGQPDTSEVAALNAWLDRESPPHTGRDPFSETGREVVRGERVSEAPVLEAPAPVEPPSRRDGSPEVPRLIGFVVARPELEADVTRRVLAALRYEGQLHLLGVGDRVGVYRVEALEARDRVELLDTVTNDRVVLELP